jgi:hypothetical protein
MEEIFGLSYVSNSIPANHTNYAGGFNYTATVNDLSDLFKGVTITGKTALNAGGCHLTFAGSAGEAYSVLASDNINLPLSQWQTVGGGRFSGGQQTFTDTGAAIHTNQFYIVRLQ